MARVKPKVVNAQMKLSRTVCLAVLIVTSAVSVYGQSRIPADPSNFLQNADLDGAGTPNTGDIDGINVIFFQVPDTVTSPVYFGVYSPGTDGGANGVDSGNLMETRFDLIGGQGALTGANAKTVDFSGGGDPTDGITPLDSFTRVNTDPNSWVYFNPVLPSDGEHIGNYYYFRVVVEVGINNNNTGNKNAYQLDLSTSGSGLPTGVPGVRSFAYAWSVLFQQTTTNVWNFHPFVPETATISDYFISYNFDADDGEVWTLFDKTGDDRTDGAAPEEQAYNVSGPSFSADGEWANTSYQIGFAEDINGTWNLRVAENNAGVAENTAEVVHVLDDGPAGTTTDAPTVALSGNGVILRTYSSEFNPPAPHEVALSAEDGSALADGVDTERIYLQVADSDGNPLPYSRDIYVEVADDDIGDGTDPQIESANNTGTALPASAALVTTDGEGIGWVEVSNNDAEDVEPVTLTAYWDSTGGSADFGTIPGSGSITVDFYSNPPPTMSSASNLIFITGSTPTHPDITIADTVTADIGTTDPSNGDIRIRIPVSLDAAFDTGVAPTVTPTGATYNAGNTGFSGGEFWIDVDSFSAGDSFLISGLQYTATNSPSSGRLEMSYDGGSTYDVIDDKFVVIQANTVFWDDGGADSNWNTALNWSTDAVPTSTDNVEIRSGVAGVTAFPTIQTGTAAQANSLIIESGGDSPSVSLNGGSLTVQGDLRVEGSLSASAAETITVGGALNLGAAGDNFTEATSTIVLTGAGTLVDTAGETGLYNLNLNKDTVTTSATLSSPLTVGGNLDFTLGTLTLGSNDLTVSGNVTSSGTGNINQSGGGAASVTGTTTLDAGARAITLDNAANDFVGSVNLTNTGGNDVTIADANAIDFSGLSLGQNLSVQTYGGGITDSGVLSVPGTSSFTVPDTQSVVLDTVGNTFTGALSFAASAGSIADISVYDTTAVDIPGVSITGTLTFTSETAIGQSGAFSANSLIATTLNDAGAAINLPNVTNDVNTAELRARESTNTTGAAGAITFYDDDDLDIVAAQNAGAANITVSAVGPLSSSGAISGGSGTILLRSDDTTAAAGITLGAGVSGAGTLRLAPITNTNPLAIAAGAASAGPVDVTGASIPNIAEGFATIVFGGGTQSGRISVSGAINPLDSVHLQAPSGEVTVGATVNTSGSTDAAAVTITGDGNTTTLSADILTDGGAVTINDTVLVDGTPTIDTEQGNNSNAGNVTITGAIDGANGNTDTLTVNAVSGGGTDGAVDLQGAYGASIVTGAAAVTGALDVDGGQVDIVNVSADSGTIDINGTTGIDLNGTSYQTTTAGAVTFTGGVTLYASPTVASSGGSNAQFTGTVDADGAANDRYLVVDAGTGGASIAGAVGAGVPLDGLDVDGATVAVRSISTEDGSALTGATANTYAVDLNATGGALTIGLDGAAGAINTNGEANGGPVNLTASGGVVVDDVDAGGAGGWQLTVQTDAGTAGAIDINSAFDDSGTDTSANLVLLQAGTANVTFDAAVGAANPLGAFDVDSGNTVTLQAVTTDAGVIRVGNSTLDRPTQVNLNGNLTSYDVGNAGAIAVHGDTVALEAINNVTPGSITLDANSAGTDGNITVSSAAAPAGVRNASTPWQDGLELLAGGGTVSIGNATLVDLDHLVINALSAALGDTTLGDGGGNAGTALSVTTTGADPDGYLTLTGDISTTGDSTGNAGAIDLSGVSEAIVLAGGGATEPAIVTITTNAPTSDQTIVLGAVEDDGTDRALYLDAGTEDITLGGAIGATDPIGALTVAQVGTPTNPGANDVAINASVSSGAITIRTQDGVGPEADSITIGAVTMDSNGGNVLLRSDDIAIVAGATLQSTGGATEIVFGAEAVGNTIGIGDGATAAVLDLAEAELQTVAASFGEIVVGATGQTGLITVNDTGGLTGLNTGLRLRGPVSLASAIVQASNPITIDGTLLVDGLVTLDTTNGDAVAAAAVTITGAIDGANSGGDDELTIDAAQGAVDGTNDAAVDLQADVEGAAGAVSVVNGQDLELIDVSGSTVSLPNITIDGVNAGDEIRAAGTAIALNGTTYQTTGQGPITFTGPVTLASSGAMTVQTPGGAGDDVTFGAASTVDDNAAYDSSLTVNAGAAGIVTFSAAVGGTTAPAAFEISNAAQATVTGVTTGGAGGIVIGSGTVSQIIANGSFDSTDADAAAVAGPITLASANIDLGAGALVTLDADDDSASDGNITVGTAAGDALDATTAGLEALRMLAGDGSITVHSDIGSGTRTGNVSATAAAGSLVTLNGDISTLNGDVNFSGVLGTLDVTGNDGGDFVVDTDGLQDTFSAGAINLQSGTLVATGIAVTADARGEGTDGDGNVTLPTSINTAGAVTARGGQISATTIVTTGGDIILEADANDDNPGGDVITLVGDLDTTNGGTELTAGAIQLTSGGGNDSALLSAGGAGVTLFTDATGTDANITISMPVHDGAGTNESLTLTAGAADVTIAQGGAIGFTDGIGLFTASGANIDFEDNVSAAGIRVAASATVGVDDDNTGNAVTLDYGGVASSFDAPAMDADDGGTAVIQGTATLLIRPTAPGSAARVGDDADAGTAEVSDDFLQTLAAGIPQVEIGYDAGQYDAPANQSGNITIDPAVAPLLLPVSVTVQGTGATTITIVDSITLTGTGEAFIVNGGGSSTTVLAGANLTTTGGAITINDNVELQGAISLNAGNGAVNGGAITVTGNIASDDATGDTLFVQSPGGTTDGTVDLTAGAVGGTAGAVDGADITGLTVSNVTLADLGPIEVSGGNMDVTAGTRIDLNGGLYRVFGAGTIDFAGPVDLPGAGAVTVQTPAAAADDVTITGAVSDTGADSSISITGALTTVDDIVVGGGSISVSGVTTGVNLTGGTYQTTAAGTIGFTGAVDLTGAVAVTVQTAGAAGDDISFSSTIDDAGSNSSISLNAGAGGDVAVIGAIGGTVGAEPDGVSVTAAALVDLNNVTTGDGAISITAGTRIDLNGLTYQTSSSGSIQLDGPVVAVPVGPINITTAGGAADTVTFTANATLNDDGVTSDVAVDAGAANVTFNAQVGNATPLGSLSVSSSATVLLAMPGGDFAAGALDLSAATGTVESAPGVGNTILLGGPIDIGGQLLLTDGTFDLGGNNVNTLGSFANNSILRLTGAETTAAALASDDDSGLTVYYNSGITPLELGNTYWDLEFESGTWNLPAALTVNNLTVSGGSVTTSGTNTIGGSVSLTGGGTLNVGGSTLDIAGSVTGDATGGTLNGGTGTIEIDGDFDDTVDGTADFTFNAGASSTVEFFNNGVDSVVGHGFTFFNLYVRTPNKTVYFPHRAAFATDAGMTIVVLGQFEVDGGSVGNEVNLLSYYTFLGNPHPSAAYTPGTSPDPEQWAIDAQGTATVFYAYVELSYAFTPIFPEFVVFRDDVSADPSWTYNWLVDLPVLQSWTQDRDGDGKIDHIRIEVEAATPLDDDFSGFEATVTGYAILGYTTYDDWRNDAGQENDQFFSIILEEKDYLDTGVTPDWDIVTNTSLEAQTGFNEIVILNAPPATPLDGAPPLIAYTLTVADSYETFLRFSEPVFDGNGGTWTDNFQIPTGSGITSFSSVTTQGGGVLEAVARTAAPVTADEILNEQLLSAAGVEDGAAAPNGLAVTTHRVSDVALGETGAGLFQPVFARDETSQDPQRGGGGLIRDFDGSEFLQPQDLTIQMSIRSDITVAVGPAEPQIVFGTDIPDRYRRSGLWLPQFDDTAQDQNGAPPPPWIDDADSFTGLVPLPTPSSEYDSAPAGDNINRLREYYIPKSNAQVRNRSNFEFFFTVPGTTGDLYGARLADRSAPWYRNVRPWAFELREIFAQRANVTITSNVINPNQGDRATLNYVLDDAGMVRINVFNVAGDLIDILQSGRQEAGEHSTTWDGTNRQGQSVARGIYFIRVMADGVDEYRKVMVVK